MNTIKYLKSTVFNAPVQTIVNTVNCFGVMGAGLALEFKLRYPDLFADYVKKCQNKEVQIGKPYVYRISDDKKILNFPTKYHWRNPSKIPWIEAGLKYFNSHYHDWGITSIAFPKLGAGKGGLDWNDVRKIMEDYLCRIDISVFICLDEAEAEGDERKMLELIKADNFIELIEQKTINKRQKEAILKGPPLTRFGDLLKIPGLGKKSYEKIFHYYYWKATGSKELTNGSFSGNQLKLNFQV